MRITGNSFSLTQFEVFSEQTLPSPEELFEKLQERRFNPSPIEMAPVNMGVVDFFSIANFALDNFERHFSAPYLFFGVRIDTRKVHKSLLQIEVDKAHADFLAKSPDLTEVPKDMKAEIGEAVLNKLLSETHPIPEFYQVIWNLESREMMIATKNKKVAERITDFLGGAFRDEDIRFRAVAPMERAKRLAEKAQDTALLEGLASLNMAHSESILDMAESNVAIWQDFLAWLLYRSYNTDASYKGFDGEPFIAFVDKKMVAKGLGSEGMQKIVIQGPQDDLNEVRSALSSGKNLEGVSLQVNYDDINEVQLYLDAMWLSLACLKFTSHVDPEGMDEYADGFGEDLATLLIRVADIEKLQRTIDSLLYQYVSARTNLSWKDFWAKQFSAWVSGELAA